MTLSWLEDKENSAISIPENQAEKNNKKIIYTSIIKILVADHEQVEWCPHHESNMDLSLRRALFYPLNYGDKEGTKKPKNGPR